MNVTRAFKILELPENAGLDEVRRVRSELILIWHPDKHQQSWNAHKRALEKTKEINEAYEFLSKYLSSHPDDIDREQKQDKSTDSSFIVCRNCGVINHTQGNPGRGFRCAKCGIDLASSSERQRGKNDWKNRLLCGDGLCTGIIGGNARCVKCGRTWEEGRLAEQLREKAQHSSTQERSAAREAGFFEKFLKRLIDSIGYQRWKSLKQEHPRFATLIKYAFLFTVTIGLLAVVSPYLIVHQPNKTSPVSSSNKAESVKPKYLRPASAPNAQSWPHASGYVKGYPKLFTNGLSTVTMDNTQTGSDVFIKLFHIDGKTNTPVRFFFVKAGEKFTVRNIRAGHYDIRYKNLDNGTFSRSQEFNLDEVKDGTGRVRHSKIELTLGKAPHGNMKTYEISEDAFETDLKS